MAQMKRKKVILLSVLGFFVLLFTSFFITKYLSTKPESKVKDAQNAPATSSEQKKADQLIILSDNVKVRKEPNSKSPEVTTLAFGSKAELIAKSDVTSKVGVYEDYWYNVKYDSKTGWIFGEFAASRDNIRAKVPKRFESTLRDLSKKEAKSVSSAVRIYRSFSELAKDPSVNDTMFRSFRTFYLDVLSQQTLSDKEQKILSSGDYGANIDKIINKDLKARLTTLKENGFTVTPSEGDFYVVEDPGFILTTFSEDVSNGIAEFLAIRKKELREGFSEDASLIISWNTLSDRINTWEKYIKKFPNQPESKEAQGYIKFYLDTYITGIDNTPVFDPNNNRLTDNVARSYERYIKQYQDSEYQPMVKIYYDTLKKSGFRYSKESKEFLQTQGINVSKLDYLLN